MEGAMMIETEAKIKLDEKEFQVLYEKLGSPNFVLQKNWGYFSGNEMVRIREEGNGKYVTLKKSNQNSKYNSREEIEFGISDVQAAREVFGILCLADECYYEKKRATKRIGGCIVCLDRITAFGDFIEVEGEAKNIEDVLTSLGLEKKPIEKRNYFELLKKVKDGMH